MEPSTSHASATDVAVVVRIAGKEKIPEPHMENVALDPILHNRLTRFLHTGNELPKYFPGCWEAQKCFTEDKLPVINEIFALTPNNVQPVKVIYKTFMDGYYSRFETIAFALSKCLKVFKHSRIRQEAYDAALQMCSTPEQLMLFNKYNRIMKTGQGQGWCKNVKKWYLNKEPMELADELTRVKSRHGRSHKTLIRKSHLKVDENNHKLDTLVKYAIYGLKKTKQLKGDIEEAKEMLEYVQKVESLRQCENPAAAAAILAEHHFTLDHVPGHLLTSQEAWDAVIPQFTMSELLFNIIRIHNLGFLRENSSTSQIILSLLTNREYVNKSNAGPLEVYITYSNYTDPVSRPMKHEKAKVAKEKETRRRMHQTFDHKKREWVPNNKRRHPKELKYSGIDMLANVSVRAEIGNLVDKTWGLSKPTGKSYMITMDMRNHMFKGRHFCKTASGTKKVKISNDKSAPGGGGDAATSAEKKSNKRLRAECFYNTKVTPGHAALVVALQLLKREKQVKIAVFTDDGWIDIVDLERNFITIDEAEVVLRKRESGRVQLDAPISWATRTKEKVDVFINMIDRPSRYMELDKQDRGGRAPGGRYGPPPTAASSLADHCPVRALQRYRDAVGVKDAKLIVMSLASHRVGTTDGSHEGVLDIVGIDEHVIQAIDAFALGQFK